MIEAERAKALADEIEEELIELRKLFKGRENDRFSFSVSFSSWDVIYAALRAYSAPVSTDVGLREAVAKAIRYADGCGLSHGGETRFCDDPVFNKAFDAAGRSLRQDTCQCRVGADAALSAIHASGWRIVPAEPTEAMIEAACATAHDYSLGICQSGPSSWPDGYTLRERVDARSMMRLALRAALATTEGR